MTHLLSEFRGRFKSRKKSNYYLSHGHKVKRGSKLDKAIELYNKKGYYVTDAFTQDFGPNQSFRKDPPTLRPALTGGTFHTKNYHHPLATKEEVLARELKGEFKQ